MISLQYAKEHPEVMCKIIEGWKDSYDRLEKQNRILKEKIEMNKPQIPECENCKKFLARIQELEEDLDRKENYVYHARDRSRED